MPVTSRSNRTISLVIVLFSLVLAAGCSPSVQVRSDVAPDVDMASYGTFNFFSQLGVESEHYSSLLGQHFRDAIYEEMTVRGYEMSEQPGLQINVSMGAKEKVKVNTYSDPYLYGGYYGYRGSAYYGSPWYHGGTRTTVNQYTEANVYVDVVDAAKHELVWQGVATFTLTDKMQKNVRESVKSTVNSIFSQYPVPAPAAGE